MDASKRHAVVRPGNHERYQNPFKITSIVIHPMSIFQQTDTFVTKHTSLTIQNVLPNHEPCLSETAKVNEQLFNFSSHRIKSQNACNRTTDMALEWRPRRNRYRSLLPKPPNLRTTCEEYASRTRKKMSGNAKVRPGQYTEIRTSLTKSKQDMAYVRLSLATCQQQVVVEVLILFGMHVSHVLLAEDIVVMRHLIILNIHYG